MIRPRMPLFFVFLPMLAMSGYIALVYQLSLIYAAFCLLGTMIGVALLLAILGLRGLAASRRHPHEVIAGVPFEVDLALENRTPAFSSMFFSVSDAIARIHEARPHTLAVLSLEPGEQAALRYRARIDRRGVKTFANVLLSSSFPFGLFGKRVTLNAASTLTVLPRPGRLVREILREQPAIAADLPVAVRGGIGEFHGVREFRHGDNPRWVHWATSARKGGAWVREFEREIDKRLLIALSAAPDPAFERSITLCATLTDVYLARGYRVALTIAAARASWVPFGTGEDHLRRILRALAEVQPTEGRLDTQWDAREIRGAQIAVIGTIDGLAPLGASLTRIDPRDTALVEKPPDELG